MGDVLETLQYFFWGGGLSPPPPQPVFKTGSQIAQLKFLRGVPPVSLELYVITLGIALIKNDLTPTTGNSLLLEIILPVYSIPFLYPSIFQLTAICGNWHSKPFI